MSEYPYPEFDQEGKVICQICGKSLNIISPSHLRKHDTNLQKYQEKFKDVHVTSEKFRVVSKFCHSPMLAPTPKPLSEIMEEVIVDAPITSPSEDLTKIIEKASEGVPQTVNKNIIPPPKPKSKNPMAEMKLRILTMLKQYFLNIQQDYEVQIFTASGHLLHEFITDFADPNQKVVINFPKTFWHNRNPDPAASNKLSEHGWKVIELYSIAPGKKEIQEVLAPYLK